MAGSLELRAAFRSLRRTPGFAAIAVLTLGVGIGGSTAVFSAVNQVLLQPLPYEGADRLVRLYQYNKNDPAENRFVSAVAYRAYRDQLSTLEDVAALYNYSEAGRDLVDAAGSERIRVLQVSSEYFSVLRAQPVMGRAFNLAETNSLSTAGLQAGGSSGQGDRVVVLSDQLWRGRYAADRTLLGRTVHLSDEALVVIGIAPPGFVDPVVGEVDAWLPLDLRPDPARDDPQNHALTVIGRLGAGGRAAATAQLDVIDRQLAVEHPRAPDLRTRVVDLHTDVIRGADRVLLVLLGATGLVLLIVCVNMANLMLIRATAREREFAIRAALGSGRRPILRQLFHETWLLALAGGLTGVVLAFGLLKAMILLGSSSVPLIAETRFDASVFGFAILVSLSSALFFGLIPGIRFTRRVVSDAMRDGSRSVTSSAIRNRSRSVLVVVQVAFAFVLLVASSILALSFHRLRTVELGIETQGVLTYEVHLTPTRYDAQQRAQFRNEMDRRVGALPGVVAAGATSRLPATGVFHPWSASAVTGPLAGDPERRSASAQQRVITSDFLQAVGIELLQGRLFAATDDSNAPMRAIISRALAERLFPNTDPLGQRIRVAGDEREVIGVASDVAVDAMGRIEPAVYHAHDQFAANRNWALTHVVRTTRDPEALIPEIRRVLNELDPQVVLFRPAAFDEILARSTSQRRFTTWLMGAFAVVALALSSLGLFGVVSFGVRQRRREMGIRMALGARPAAIRRMVIGGALRMALLGVAIGALGSVASARLLNALVFETSPLNPLLIASSALVMTLVAMLASYLPVREATSIEPSNVLGE